ncbi:MAG: uroporphyrinogen decarboxylase family protein [Candidatus Helarchaeota archaeon]
MKIEEIYELFLNKTKNRKYQESLQIIKNNINNFKPQDLLLHVVTKTLNNLQSYQEKGYSVVSAFQVLAASKIVEDTLELIKPLLINEMGKGGREKIILGNAYQDHHTLGKKIIKVVLEANGFEVIDLGESVPASKFVDAALRENAKWILVSAMMYNTALSIERVKEELIKREINDVKIIAGGAPFNFHHGFYKKIKADFTAINALETLEVLKTKKQLEIQKIRKSKLTIFDSRFQEETMTPLERVLATVTGEVPDRVPIFPLTTSISAKILNITLPSLYRSGENIFKGQMKFQEKFGHDYVTSFFYLVKDAECWGVKPIYFETGDPNLAKNPFGNLNDFLNVETPSPNDSEAYDELKKAIQLFSNSKLKGKVPIIGVITGPFSLPSFFFNVTRWLEALLINPDIFAEIIKKVTPFTIECAKLQLELGVDIILFVDGVVSNTMIPLDVFQKHVTPVYKKIVSSIKAPVVLGGAGGEFRGVLDEIIKTGVKAATLSSKDDLKECKRITDGKISLLGNLNNIEFVDWLPTRIEEKVKNTINIGTQDLTRPGFILMNQHNFPQTITLDQIDVMVKSAKKHGQYK